MESMQISYMAIPGLDVRLPLTGIEMLIKKHTGIGIEEIRSANRTRAIADARHLFCKLATDRTGKDKMYIGHYIGRDRTTVIHSCLMVETVPDLMEKYKEIKNGMPCTN